MDDLLQFIPEEKQEEFKTAFSGAGYIKGADETILMDAVKGNQRVFDLITKDPMENRIKNFKEKDLPGLLEAAKKEAAEAVRNEINPKETEEMKRIREIENKYNESEAQNKLLLRKSELREKYKDIDSLAAESLASLDDEIIDKHMQAVKGLKDKIAELEKTVKYGGSPPKKGKAAEITMKRADFDNLPASEQTKIALDASEGKITITD